MVGKSPKVDISNNLQEFDKQHETFLRIIDGPYHPLIYNQGNVTNEEEFSRTSLRHVLNAFQGDSRIVFVSINSRQWYITDELLDFFLTINPSFPIHFILGVESFSPRAKSLFGKDTSGEFEKLNEILRPINQKVSNLSGIDYKFGLDVNLVFLPEMYIPDGATRYCNEAKIAEGMRWELAQLLSRIDPFVPVEINIHPYYNVKALPYEDMGLDLLMGELPKLQGMVAENNKSSQGRDSHLFIGVEGSGYQHSLYQGHLKHLGKLIKEFNATGDLPTSFPRL